MQCVRVHEFGGPEVLRLEEAPTPTPGPRQALVKLATAGVNYLDIYVRAGLYKSALPLTLGSEGVGTVEAVGPDVAEVAVGDRVGWAMFPGSYATHAVVPAAQLVPIPAEVSDRDAAAALLQGMTAHYLATSTYPLQRGDTCLVHAAAGGVGQLLCQVAKMRGARVIGTAGSEQKAAVARAAGADAVILYREQDFAAEVRRLTDGAGVQVVYDSVGKDTFDRSLTCLARRGLLVLFGQSSGPIPPFDPQVLNARGWLFLTRPTLGDYTATRAELLGRASDVFGWIASGQLRLAIERTYPLAEAAAAHRALASRETAGKVLLTP